MKPYETEGKRSAKASISTSASATESTRKIARPRKVDPQDSLNRESGFTLVEVLVSLLITVVVMSSVYQLLANGQQSFEREVEISAMTQSARAGLTRLSRDLLMAGYRTPPMTSILWHDGGGDNPDEITIIHADTNVPLSRPVQCGAAGSGGGGGPCGTIARSATLLLDPLSLDPAPPNPEDAYRSGMVLAAIETSDCNEDGQIGIVPFTVTTEPVMTMAGGAAVLSINHNPGASGGELNPPGGFNREVREDCAVIGQFRIISYRISPAPPTENPILERRDLSEGSDWHAVAHNIENLQFRYGIGAADAVVDVPAPPTEDPITWINRVDFTLTGRTERKNLQGASAGVFDPDDIYIRRTFSSMMSLRNVASQAANRTLAGDTDES